MLCMKSFSWKHLNFRTTILWRFNFVFLEQPGHWHTVPDWYLGSLFCWAGDQRKLEKGKEQDRLLCNPQTGLRFLLFCLGANPPWKRHLLEWSDGTIIFPYQQSSNAGSGKKTRLTWTKLSGGINCDLLAYIYHCFIGTGLEIRFLSFNCHSYII